MIFPEYSIETDDATLIRWIQSGKPISIDAFATLHSKHCAYANQVARNRLRPCCQSLVDDCVNQAFFIVFQGIDKYEELGKFKRWLCTIIRYVAFSMNRACRHSINVSDEVLQQIPIPDGCPCSIAIESEKLAKLNAIVDAQTTDKEKDNFKRRFVDGIQVSKLDKGKSATANRKEFSRATKRLRTVLIKYSEFEDYRVSEPNG